MSSFQPPKRILMGPGPSDVSPRVLSALARPTIGHLDPEFVRLMDEVKLLLKWAFKTNNELTFPVSAPGSAAMETCFVNLLEPGDKVVVCENGVFGGRMRENVERCGAIPIMVSFDWGLPVELNAVEAVLKDNPDAKVLAFVHAETSTGARSDAKALCQLAQQYDCLSIVDAVTSLAGIELDIDAWGADAVYSGTQKCLSCLPGIAPVTFSPKAVAAIQARKTKVQSWFLDLNLVMGYWNEGAQRSYHHTAPVNMVYALHEALTMLKEEGLEASWARHALMHKALAAGLDQLGLNLVVAEGYRLPQLNAVSIPDGVDDKTVRAALLSDYGLEIGAGLGSGAGKVWRIGLMGSAATKTNVLTCLSALEDVLSRQGVSLEAGKAVAAAQTVLA